MHAAIRSVVAESVFTEENPMRSTTLTIPEIGLIAATRGMLGAGIALLFASKLTGEQQRVIGWTLVGVGLITTVPLLLDVLGKSDERFEP